MAHEGHDHDHGETDEAPVQAAPASSVASFAAPLGRFESCRRVLHVDPIGGAAGDMLIAAFLDLGVPPAVIERAIASTGLTGYRLELGRRDKHAIAARSFDVVVDSEQPPRDYATIAKLLEEAPLDERVRTIAAHVFLRLGEAEAKVHRQPLARVHFHEVGGVDAIADIVGASAAIAHLGDDLGLSIGALPMSSGTTRGAHGAIPLPAPATMELLIGLPVRDSGITGELVTPTGAALLRAFSELFPSRFGGFPSFVPRAIGYGAGKRDLADRPNVVRLILGDVTPRATTLTVTLTVLEANLDDATGEVAAVAIETLLQSGARDAWVQPITMKKGRPAMLIGVLCDVDRADALARILMAETGSLGVRTSQVERIERPRRFLDVDTAYGNVRVKIADGDGLPIVVHPELDACRARATEHSVPVREVIRAAIAATRT